MTPEREKELIEAVAEIVSFAQGEPDMHPTDAASIIFDTLRAMGALDGAWTPFSEALQVLDAIIPVYRPDQGVFAASWVFPQCDCCVWPETCSEEPGWFSTQGDDLSSSDLTPTHFYRLPAPPKGQTNEA